MKYLLPIFICCLVALHARAQKNKELTLTGSLKMQNGQNYPYKLVFTDSAGRISGYSITYDAPEDAQTLIKGKIDRTRRTISFHETEIVYSHGYHINTYMCLIKAKLEYVQNGGGNVLSSPISSSEADNTSCAGGTVVFANAEEIKNVFASHEQFDTVITMQRKTPVAASPASIQPKQEAREVAEEKITMGADKMYQWHTDSLVLEAWDGGQTDGDRITIQLNGGTVLSQHALTKEHKTLRLPITKGVTTVVIIAENEGSDPPNTANLRLTDGNIHYNVVSYNARGDRSVIRIQRD